MNGTTDRGQPDADSLHASMARYGADIARWPAERRPDPARLTELLGRDAALADAFAQEQRLDAALAGIDPPAVDDLRMHRLQQRILAALPPQVPTLRPEDAAYRPHVAADTGTAPLHRDPVAAGTVHAQVVTALALPAPRALRLRRRFGPALAALVPLVLGFGAGLSGSTDLALMARDAYGTQQPAQVGATEADYADETTMAPFLLASAADTMTLEWQP